MNVKKKICWISAIIVGVLVVCIIVGSRIGYIPVVGTYIADAKLSSYTGEKIRTSYNFYNSSYVVPDFGKVLRYELSANTIFDETYSRQVNSWVNRRYRSFITESSTDAIEYPSIVEATARVDADDTSKVYVNIYCATVFDDTQMSVEDSKKRICELAEQLVESIDMNCTSLQIVYANKSGMFQLNCDFGKDSIRYDELPNYIEQFEEDKLPLDYMEWRGAD